MESVPKDPMGDYLSKRAYDSAFFNQFNSMGDDQSNSSGYGSGSEPQSARSSFRSRQDPSDPYSSRNAESEDGISYEVPIPQGIPTFFPGMGYMSMNPLMSFPMITQYQPQPMIQRAPLSTVEEQKEELHKKKAKKLGKTTTVGKEIKDKRKRRLEQNRVSARESRKKKKAYIETLESEV